MALARKARIGVIGTGWWATYTHIPALLARSDVDLVALANRGVEKLRLAAAACRVDRTYTDFREMLNRESLDGVVIATPQPTHYEIARATLDRGCHVLLEKPMVLDPGEARHLVELASRRQRQIVMSYPWHYNRQVLRAREALRSGELGHVQMISSHFASSAYETYRGNLDAYTGHLESPVVRQSADLNTDVARGGGQAYVQVTHSAALAFWVTGLSAQQVNAYMHHFDVAVDVVDAIAMRMSNGAVGVVSSSGNLPPGDPGQHTLSVYCRRGYLLLDLIAGTRLIRAHDGAVESPMPLPPEERNPRFAPANNLVDVILGRADNLAPGESGRIAVNFLDAAHRSAVTGGVPVAVEA